MQSIFQVLTLLWSLNGGQYFNDNLNLNGEFQGGNPYFVDTKVELQVPLSWQKGDESNLFIGADTESQFFKSAEFWGFAPWQDSYIFSAGIRAFGLEVGFQHECVHPVLSQGVDASQLFASYDKVYLKLQGKM